MADRGKRDLKFLLFAIFLLAIAVSTLAYCRSPIGGPPPALGAPPLGSSAR